MNKKENNMTNLQQNGALLNIAVVQEGSEKVKELLEAGVDVNTKNDESNTPLISIAIKYVKAMRMLLEDWKIMKIMKMLVDAGADVNIKNNNGDTALNILVKEDYSQAIQLMLDSNADVNTENNELTTPIMRVVSNKFMDVKLFNVLVSAGADVNKKNKEGVSVFGLAIRNKQFSIVKTLMDNGLYLKEDKYNFVFEKQAIRFFRDYDQTSDESKLTDVIYDFWENISDDEKAALYKFPAGFVKCVWTRLMTNELFLLRMKIVLDTLHPEFAGNKISIFDSEKDEKIFFKHVNEIIAGEREYTFPKVNEQIYKYVKGQFKSQSRINLVGFPKSENPTCFGIRIKQTEDKERKFKTFLSKINKKRTINGETAVNTMFAFHGSPLGNWYSILKDGITLSKMVTSRFYGQGVYFSDNFSAAYTYARGPVRVVGVFEIVSESKWLKRVELEPLELVYGSTFDPNKRSDWNDGMILRYLIVETDPKGQQHSPDFKLFHYSGGPSYMEYFLERVNVDSESLITYLEQDFSSRKVVESNLNSLENGKKVKTSSRLKPWNELIKPM